MLLKLHEVVTLYYELNGFTANGQSQPSIVGLLRQKMSLKTKIYLQRLNKIASDEFEVYEKSKRELFNKYGNEKDGQIEIPNENLVEFNAEHWAILNVQKQIDVQQLWGDDLNIESLNTIETTDSYPVLFKIMDLQ